MRRMTSAVACAVMFVAALAAPAAGEDTRFAGAPVDDLIRVNRGGGATHQWMGSVAPNESTGGYLVAWEDDRSGGPEIFVRVFDAMGDPLSNDRRISPAGANATQARAVYIEGTNEFLVFWRSSVSGSTSLMVRRVQANAKPVGVTRTVVDETLQHGWDVAVNTSTDQVMLSWRQDFDLYARPLLPTGRPDGRKWRVAVNGYNPALAYNPTNDQFGIVYSNVVAPLLAGRRLVGTTGKPTSAVKTISPPGAVPRNPDIAFDPDIGRFLVIWEDARNALDSPDAPGGPSSNEVYGRQFTQMLGPFGERLLGSVPSVEDAHVAYNPTGGGYVVGWTDGPTAKVQEITRQGNTTGPARSVSGPGSDASIGFDITCNGGGGACMAVWQDRRRETARGVDIMGRIVSAGEWLIRPGRVGPVKLGSLIVGLPADTGMAWTIQTPGAPNCKVANPVSGWWINVQGYLSVRDIWVTERFVGRTPEGIRVGDSKQDVLNAYGSRASVQPGPYVGEIVVVDGPLTTDWGYVFFVPVGTEVSTIYVANHDRIAEGGCL